MHRIDSADSVTTLPTPAPAGTPAYFSGGNVGTGVQGTIVDADWANAVQEEIAYTVTQSGQTLSKTDTTQLRKAVVLHSGDTMTGNLSAPSLYANSGTSFGLHFTSPLFTLAWDAFASDTYNPASPNERSWFNTHNVTNSQIMVLQGSTGNLYLNTAVTCARPGGGAWDAISDDRAKKEARPYTAGLDEVCRLDPIAFTYNGEHGTNDDGRTYVGLSAQATQPVMPELVVPDIKPGVLGTNLGPLTLALVNACKELAASSRELAARVQALEARAATA